MTAATNGQVPVPVPGPVPVPVPVPAPAPASRRRHRLQTNAIGHLNISPAVNAVPSPSVVVERR